MQMVYEYLLPYVEKLIVHSITTDTYKREIERYGENSIEHLETLFYYDSEFIANIISSTEGEEGEQIKWQICLRTLDELLNLFGFDFQQKHQLLKTLSLGFMNEFGTEKNMDPQISIKYRESKKQVEVFLNCSLTEDNELLPLFIFLENYKKRAQPVISEIIEKFSIQQINIPMNDLIGSYFHMHCNRLFRTKQRLHEMIIYSYLERYYKSFIAREKM